MLSTLLALLGLAPKAGPLAAPPSTLTVYAAASLTEAFTELGRRLEAAHPGLRVRFNFAGSQQLAVQIAQGAPADVYAAADQRWMDYAVEKGAVEGEPRVFARNRLVVIVPRANAARIGKLTELARGGLKLVMAAEAVPAGRYTREALEQLARAPGFPDRYDRRVLGNVVSQEENVKGVVAKVQLGEADAGFVYRSDVTPSGSRFLRVIEIPDEYNVFARYPIAVLKGASGAQAGRWFVDLVMSEPGQQTLARHGLLPGGTAQPAGAHP